MGAPEATLSLVDAGQTPSETQIFHQDPKKVKELALTYFVLGILMVLVGTALVTFGSGSPKSMAVGILSPLVGVGMLAASVVQRNRSKSGNGTLLIGLGWVLVRDAGKVTIHALAPGSTVRCVVGKSQSVSVVGTDKKSVRLINDVTFGPVELIANAVQRAVPR